MQETYCAEAEFDFIDLVPYAEQIDAFAQIIEREWPDWDYHNFIEHGLETFFEYLALMKYARANGVEVSEEEVVGGALAALDHDVANHWGEPLLHDSDEARSAEIGYGLCMRLGFSRTIADKKREANMATQPGAICETFVEKGERRADVANLGWEYDRFEDRTIKVWREAQKNCMKEGKELVSFSIWVRGIKDFVMDKLLDQDLAFGDFDRGASGQSVFHERAFDNFATLDTRLKSPDWIEPSLDLAA